MALPECYIVLKHQLECNVITAAETIGMLVARFVPQQVCLYV